jgi:hypothetical protein
VRVAALLAAECAVSLAVAGSAPSPVGARGFELVRSRAVAEFPLYSAGDQVDGLPLTAVLRRDDTADFVSFVYGDCVARDDEGCAPPVEVQVWPACRRNLNLYASGRPGTPVPERTTTRGVPAAFLDDGTRLELQTSRSTVVVFADSRIRVLRVAAALRPVGEHAPSGPLPPPAPGAVQGTLAC